MYFLLIINLMTFAIMIGHGFLINKSIKIKREWIESNNELIKILTEFQPVSPGQVEVIIQGHKAVNTRMFN